MSAVTIRDLPEETHRALELRASRNGNSTETEIRQILEEAVRSEPRVKIGSELAAFGRRFGGIDIESVRDSTVTEAASFD